MNDQNQMGRIAGRPSEPRLASAGPAIRRYAQRKFGTLKQFYAEALNCMSAAQKNLTLGALRRQFERAFNGNGPFGIALQEVCKDLIPDCNDLTSFLQAHLFPEILQENFITNIQTTLRLPQPKKIQIVSDGKDLAAAQLELVASANTEVLATGSWARNVEYFRAIEQRLRGNPEFSYYRVFCGPPRNSHIVAHISRVIEIRDPDHHFNGRRTLCIGHANNDREPERNILTSDTSAIIALPTLSHRGGYDTALVVEDPAYAKRWGHFVHDYLQHAQRFDTRAAVINYLSQVNFK